MCDGSVEGDRTLAADRVNYVCLKSFAVHQVPDQNAFILFQSNKLGKISGNA